MADLLCTIHGEGKSMRTIDSIILHCSASPNGRHHTAADIDSWHKQRGWSGIGYHFVVLTSGLVENGRPVSQIGAHTRGHNQNSIGICMIGTDKFYASQFVALRSLVVSLCAEYNLDLEHSVHGHNEFANKSCPVFSVSDFIEYCINKTNVDIMREYILRDIQIRQGEDMSDEDQEEVIILDRHRTYRIEIK